VDCSSVSFSVLAPDWEAGHFLVYLATTASSTIFLSPGTYSPCILNLGGVSAGIETTCATAKALVDRLRGRGLGPEGGPKAPLRDMGLHSPPRRDSGARALASRRPRGPALDIADGADTGRSFFVPDLANEDNPATAIAATVSRTSDQAVLWVDCSAQVSGPDIDALW
jgi:hypothetical protein